MFCSNCGAELPPNGICIKCGVPAQNMTFTGNMQGRPVVPQQEFYNPNPMYVQYQGPQQGYGYGQPYVQQENVAIGGIKDPKLVAGIGAVIKDSCGSMMTVIAALLTTVAMIFSFLEIYYVADSYVSADADMSIMASLMLIVVRCIPFIMFTIGLWMITFHGYGTYRGNYYNNRACMETSGFSTVQAGAIIALVATACFGVLVVMMLFMVSIVGVGMSFGATKADEDVLYIIFGGLIITVALIVMIIMQSSVISQMSKIKHAIRGRNYESISMLLPVLLFVMAVVQVINLIFSAINGEVIALLISGVYALCYAFIGCTLLYIRGRVNSYISGR